MILGLLELELTGGSPILLLALIAALGVASAVLGAYVLLSPAVVDRRLTQFVSGSGAFRRPTIDFSRGTPNLFGAIDRQLTRRNQAATTRLLLQRANLPVSVSEFISIRVAVGVVAGVAIAVLQYDYFGLAALGLGALVGLAVSFIPNIVLGFLANRRVGKLEAQLPDALDTVAGALQAGAGLSQAFLVITKEMLPPVSEEFQRVLREIEVGLSLNEALGNMATRMGSEDLDLVVTTISIQSRVGGNLVEILHTITHTIRERIRIRGEIVVLTAMQRLSAFVIGGVPPGLGVIIFFLNRPYIMHLFTSTIGWIMMGIAVFMTLLGIFALVKITQIEV
ncbi:MAG TPA: type II secretion system F family protein [Chloroflexota bacterium]|nr:type II secretion system F family protein [Chloroflexota bacterium]